uniref:Uncharacterized protein n=1 Tax=Arundo donax TaxID=35708 RepID=A0A0A9HRA9_ARUDO
MSTYPLWCDSWNLSLSFCSHFLSFTPQLFSA